jgi:hypothetical protein
MWNLISVHVETVLVSVQDSWMVCAKRMIRSEIDSDAPDYTVCDECTIGLDIILDAPGGNPR